MASVRVQHCSYDNQFNRNNNEINVNGRERADTGVCDKRDECQHARQHLFQSDMLPCLTCLDN